MIETVEYRHPTIERFDRNLQHNNRLLLIQINCRPRRRGAGRRPAVRVQSCIPALGQRRFNRRATVTGLVGRKGRAATKIPQSSQLPGRLQNVRITAARVARSDHVEAEIGWNGRGL
jgi:hypothetical protein